MDISFIRCRYLTDVYRNNMQNNDRVGLIVLLHLKEIKLS